MENNKNLNDIDINKIYTKLNENLDFKFGDLFEEKIIEENSEEENKMDIERKGNIIEQKDDLKLEGENLDYSDNNIIKDSNIDYNLDTIYDEVLKNMDNINVSDTDIKKEIENSPTKTINALKLTKPRKRKADDYSSDSNKEKNKNNSKSFKGYKKKYPKYK